MKIPPLKKLSLLFAALPCIMGTAPLPAADIDSQLIWQEDSLVLKARISGELTPPELIKLERQAAMITTLKQADAAMDEKRSKEEQDAFLAQVVEDIQLAATLVDDRQLESAARDVKREPENARSVKQQLDRAKKRLSQRAGISMSVRIEEEKTDRDGDLIFRTIWTHDLLLSKDDISVVPLDRINDKKTRYRVSLVQGNYKEILTPTFAKSGVHTYGVKYNGTYPDNKAWLTLGMFPLAKQETAIPVEIILRDSDDNPVYTGQAKIDTSEDQADADFRRFPLIPQEGSIGPYEAEVTIDHDALNFYGMVQLSLANSRVPVTSFEESDPSMWFVGPGDPIRKTTGTSLYANYMGELMQVPYPRIEWDTEVKHTGNQALRFGYDFQIGKIERGRDRDLNCVIWSRLSLPGKATHLSLWVKGNGSTDTLYIHYVDRVNYGTAGWAANPNTGSEVVGTLNFTGWRQFHVPVFGDGVLVESRLGSSKNIDGPMSIMAFRIETGSLPEGKAKGDATAIWIDDIRVDSQTSTEEQLTMEVVPNGDTLTADSRIRLSLGNGTGRDLPKGQINLLIREDGKPVYTRTVEMPADQNAFMVKEIDLREVAALSVTGPVTIDLTFTDPTLPGIRISRHVVFKRATQGGLIQDFEVTDSFNSYDAAKKKVMPSVSTLTAGDKNTGTVLNIRITGDELNSNALVHPTLPGMPASVSMKVKGTGSPVTLQAFFIDSGQTGVDAQPYNLFWTEPVKVDWQGWKDVSLAVPAIPAHYGDKTKYFFRKPWYPLNLIIGGTTSSGEVAQLLIDDIRISTHVPQDEELHLSMEYPDSTQLHEPGSPLVIKLINLGPKRTVNGTYTLRHFQGFVAAEGTVDLHIDAGQLLRTTLVPTLDAGIYELTVNGIGASPLKQMIQVVAAREYFGDDVMATLSDPLALRRQLSLLTEKVQLDWDNSEAAPYLYHYNWFRTFAREKSMDGALTVSPLVGYSADWAGLEARDAVANNSYVRNYPNSIQRPDRLIDWSLFVREMAREYHNEFKEWIFWENPDQYESPQGIPAEQYADMLNVFHRWIKLYNPGAKVIAGGFNFDTALPYLDKVIFDPETGESHPEKLKFDAISVQMNIGELTPERADMEGFLDDLNQTLQLNEQKKEIQMAELDWAIGEYLSPLQQASYHCRAQLILDSRNATRHQFLLMNGGNEFLNHGVFWKESYGNNIELQTFRPNMVPKPAYFSIMHTQSFLKDWQFVKSVKLSDRSSAYNRAYIYRNAEGYLCLATWRTRSDERFYAIPETWKGVTYTDGFGFPMINHSKLALRQLPGFAAFPQNYSLDQLVHELRALQTSDGTFPVIANLHLAEEASCSRANYEATGALSTLRRSDTIPGGERVTDIFTRGITGEQFQFTMDSPGDALLSRIWYMTSGQVVEVTLNGGEPIQWDLQRGDGDFSGIRKSTLVLKACKEGVNTLTLRYPEPTENCSFRITPITNAVVHLDDMGILNTEQAHGDLLLYQSVSATPLKINKTTFDRGMGMHAKGFVEYPLNQQFSKLVVTLGIDASTEGRGTVKVLFVADGKVLKTTDILNGFTEPTEITLEQLDDVNRLLIVIDDAGDGDKMDYTNIVEGKLYVK